MKSSRSAPIALRFDSTTKAALALIADRKGRSMALMMEWLIRKHCDKESLGWTRSRSSGKAALEGALLMTVRD